MTVLAVTEVCLAHPAHSQVNFLQLSSQPFRPPQPGQTKPSGHRAWAMWRAQAASSGNFRSNCVLDMVLSWIQRLDMTRT